MMLDKFAILNFLILLTVKAEVDERKRSAVIAWYPVKLPMSDPARHRFQYRHYNNPQFQDQRLLRTLPNNYENFIHLRTKLHEKEAEKYGPNSPPIIYGTERPRFTLEKAPFLSLPNSENNRLAALNQKRNNSNSSFSLNLNSTHLGQFGYPIKTPEISAQGIKLKVAGDFVNSFATPPATSEGTAKEVTKTHEPTSLSRLGKDQLGKLDKFPLVPKDQNIVPRDTDKNDLVDKLLPALRINKNVECECLQSFSELLLRVLIQRSNRF